ncbi:MAG: endonuclease/exonuclease/phosphatase family protein [Bacteroidota bacterium]
MKTTLQQLMREKLILFAALLFSTSVAFAQNTDYQVSAIGFYNFENLFDTLDAPDIRDEEFTPEGSKRYGTTIYTDKLNKLARVVGEMATDVTPDGVGILGVAEIENRAVLEDFVAHPTLADRNYQIVHFDSPDRRGIDVALLYQEKYFTVDTAQSLRMRDLYYADGDTVFTRDILHVAGQHGGEALHIFVGHWPSRRGGEAASSPLRQALARRFKESADSIQAIDPAAKIILMGDLNDDPVSPSVADVVGAVGKQRRVPDDGFFNPMYSLFRQGLGTLAYRDAWSLFDQIILNDELIREDNGWRYYQTHIFNEPYMYQRSGRFRGYPLRTWVGDNYMGGFSDHFPVYVLLVKAIE